MYLPLEGSNLLVSFLSDGFSFFPLHHPFFSAAEFEFCHLDHHNTFQLRGKSSAGIL